MLIANTDKGQKTSVGYVSNYVQKLLVILAKRFSIYSARSVGLSSCLKGAILQVTPTNCEHYVR